MFQRFEEKDMEILALGIKAMSKTLGYCRFLVC
jgi:hypothetical protein